MTERDILATDQTHADGRSPQESPDAINIGQRLMQARLARQLTIEEVAGQLHLQVRHLDALEQQDLSRLPGPSYICGYLRSYAKFLHLPSDEIVENYPGVHDHIAGVKSTVVSTKLYTKRSFDLSQPHPRPAWLGAVGMLVALLLGGWLVFQMTDQNVAPPSLVTPARQAIARASPSPTVAANPVAPVPEAPSAAPTVSADVIAALPPSTPVATLILEFTGDSWVEIYDAGERRLVYEAVRSGETRIVKGQAPFKLMLGAVKDVQVRLNGTRFDMKPYQLRESAVFQVGSAQDNRIEAGGE